MDPTLFFKHLRRSRLLTEEQIGHVASRLPGAPVPTLADTLVAEGLLTDYQAEQLLRGNSKGFLLGPYRILGYLGRGGLACVFRAVHALLERVVAVKVLRPGPLPPNLALDVFRWEARTLARLAHPNIVTAYDAGRAKGVYFLVLECVDGPNLRKLVRRGGPLPVGLACELARQTAGALQYAHDRGITHRDVKPANLVVGGLPGWGPPGVPGAGAVPVVKLLDFGLAYLAGADARLAAEQAAVDRALGEVCGTPEFMSPEQAEPGRVLDVRSDLYSLGCTLFFALAGRPPFTGTAAAEVLLKHAIDDPVPLRKYRRDVPAGLWDVVRRLLAKDPAARFPTPAEVAQALAPWCGPPEAVPGPPAPAAGRTWSESDHETGRQWQMRSAAQESAPHDFPVEPERRGVSPPVTPAPAD